MAAAAGLLFSQPPPAVPPFSVAPVRIMELLLLPQLDVQGLRAAALAAPPRGKPTAVTIKQSLWQPKASTLHAGADERDVEPALTPAPWEVLELAHPLPTSDSKGTFQPG